MDPKATLRDAVSDLAPVSGRGFEDGANLLTAGIIDSLGMLRLVDFVERTWGFKVPDEDVTMDNFGSVEAIAAYLERRK